jgi:hypothetical protein
MGAKIGLDSGTMLPEKAAALVGAGVLSVIVYPRSRSVSAAPAHAHSSRHRSTTATDRRRDGRLLYEALFAETEQTS